MRKIILWSAISLGVALCFVFYIVNPETSSFFPKCPFLWLTGYQCPGCGSQRAVHALLHGDFAMAWHYNALLIISIPYILLLIYSEMYKQKETKINRLYLKIHNPQITLSYLIIVMLFTIFRNIL